MSPRLAAWTAVMALTAGCGGGKRLEGSLTTVINLKYETAEVHVTPESLSLRFLRAAKDGVGNDVVLEVAARAVGLTLAPALDINLAELLEDERPRGVLARNVAQDPSLVFPDIERGSWTLDAVPEVGLPVSGEFSATLVNGIQSISGLTVYGSYEATVP